MRTTQTAPQSKDTASQVELYMSFELADKTWKLTISDGRRGPSRYSVDAGDTVAVLECLTKRPFVICGSQPRADLSDALENLVTERLGTAGFRREI